MGGVLFGWAGGDADEAVCVGVALARGKLTGDDRVSLEPGVSGWEGAEAGQLELPGRPARGPPRRRVAEGGVASRDSTIGTLQHPGAFRSRY